MLFLGMQINYASNALLFLPENSDLKNWPQYKNIERKKIDAITDQVVELLQLLLGLVELFEQDTIRHVVAAALLPLIKHQPASPAAVHRRRPSPLFTAAHALEPVEGV